MRLIESFKAVSKPAVKTVLLAPVFMAGVGAGLWKDLTSRASAYLRGSSRADSQEGEPPMPPIEELTAYLALNVALIALLNTAAAPFVLLWLGAAGAADSRPDSSGVRFTAVRAGLRRADLLIRGHA